MKKIYLFLFFFAGLAQAQIVDIPSANFKTRLLAATATNSIAKNAAGNSMKIDTNNDGEIQVAEAAAVYQLNIYSGSIGDLTGIEAFVSLTYLDCENNNITSLDMTSSTNLKTLVCWNNDLTTLNISGLIHLEDLKCQYNQLTVLDASGLIALKKLQCYENSLTSLNVAGDVNLQEIDADTNNFTTLSFNGLLNLKKLDVGGSQLTSLSFVNLPVLENLGCGGNQLTALDVSNLPALKGIICNNNFLTTIDLFGNPLLVSLWCPNNQFTSLDFSGNPVFSSLLANNNNLQFVNFKNGGSVPFAFDGPVISNNPNLAFVCVDAGDEAMVNALLTTSGLTNVNINTYCSFIPGGEYNTITGTAIFDSGNNSCDAGDPAFPYLKMSINDGTNQGATFTNVSANYSFYTQAGTFTVTPDIENPAFFNISPANVVVNFPDNNNAVSTNNFCISANGIHQDLEIVIAQITPARPGFNAQYSIVYKNKGNQTVSLPDGIMLQYNNDVLDFVFASEPFSIQGTNSLNWDYLDLQPFESHTIYVTFHVNAPTDTPAVNIGDLLQFTAGISPNNNDENVDDNTFVYTQTVVGSFDPNDITCLEGETVSPDEIGNYLHYIINFENTGTFAAENIVVKIQIDPAKFDVSSLRIMNAPHLPDTRIQDNKIEFIFQNIQLAAGAQGHVLFKIRSNQSLITGNMVSNSANIFFDYNFPVATNIATTTFATLSAGDTIKDSSLSVYPNPASDIINVYSLSDIRSIELFDAQGRLLLVKANSDAKSTLDTSKYSGGIYYVRVTTEKGIKTAKVIKK